MKNQESGASSAQSPNNREALGQAVETAARMKIVAITRVKMTRFLAAAKICWLLALAFLAGMAPGLASAASTFMGPGLYTGIQSGNFDDWLVGEAAYGNHARWNSTNPGQRYEITSVGAGGAYFQLKNIDYVNTTTPGNNCLAYNSGGYLTWVACPTAAAPNTNAQFDIVSVTYLSIIAPAWAKSGLSKAMKFVSSPTNCIVQSVDASSDTDAWAHACDDLSSAGIPYSGMWKDGGTSTLTSKLHLLLTQANTSSVPSDNTPKTVTVTSCSNATVGTCTPVTSDNQTVTVSIVTGTATLTNASSVSSTTSVSVQLSNGVGSFTVKSLTAGDIQLKTVPANASYPGATGTCNRNGALTGESAWTTTNVECRVTFSAASTLGHIRFEYDPSIALLCKAEPITIRACTEGVSAVGTVNPTCTPYTGGTTVTPKATTTATGAVLTWSPPSSSFPLSIDTTGVRSDLTLANTDDTTPVVLSLASGTLECYDSVAKTVVDCASALTYHVCSFDAVEHGADWKTQTNLYTKLAGVDFPNSGIDLKMGYKGAINTDYNGTPTVELVDDSTGTGCNDRTTLTGVTFTLSGVPYTPSVSPTFVKGEYKALGVNSTKATARVKVRIKDAAYSPGYACSTDSFTIRPTEFSLALGGANPLVAGQASDSPTATGFTLKATARKGWNTALSPPASTGDVGGGYGGTPTDLSWAAVTAMPDSAGAKDPSAEITVSSGSITTLGAGDGVKATQTFFFDDFGTLTFANTTNIVVDKNFTGPSTSGDWVMTGTPPTVPTGVDCIIDNVTPANSYSNIPTGGKYGCYVGSAALTPLVTSRFRPDHYAVISKVVSPCVAGVAGANSFTYFGQPFAAGTAVKLTALSAHGSTMGRLHGTSLATGSAPFAPSYYAEAYNDTASIGSSVSLGGSTTVPSSGSPASNWSAGMGTYTINNSNFVIRGATPPSALYDNFKIALVVKDYDTASIPDSTSGCADSTTSPTKGAVTSTTTGVTSTGGYTTSTCVPPNQGSTRLRYGMLQLENAYGSELLPLYMQVRALYWSWDTATSTGRWIRNPDDSCTSITNANIDIGNYKGSLSAATLSTATILSASPLTLSSGVASLKFDKPLVTGNADVAINLNPSATTLNSACVKWDAVPSSTGAGMPWLQGAWCTSTYIRDPSARISFGTAKSPYLYMREKY